MSFVCPCEGAICLTLHFTYKQSLKFEWLTVIMPSQKLMNTFAATTVCSSCVTLTRRAFIATHLSHRGQDIPSTIKWVSITNDDTHLLSHCVTLDVLNHHLCDKCSLNGSALFSFAGYTHLYHLVPLSTRRWYCHLIQQLSMHSSFSKHLLFMSL